MIPGQALKCQCPADVYLLLKSSDFISHDLDHAFDECIDYEPEKEEELVEEAAQSPQDDLAQLAAQLALQEQDRSATDSSDDEEVPAPPTRRKKSPYEFELVLKKWFDMPKSQEWRCFVKDRELVGALLVPSRELSKTDLDLSPQPFLSVTPTTTTSFSPKTFKPTFAQRSRYSSRTRFGMFSLANPVRISSLSYLLTPC